MANVFREASSDVGQVRIGLRGVSIGAALQAQEGAGEGGGDEDEGPGDIPFFGSTPVAPPHPPHPLGISCVDEGHDIHDIVHDIS